MVILFQYSAVKVINIQYSNGFYICFLFEYSRKKKLNDIMKPLLEENKKENGRKKKKKKKTRMLNKILQNQPKIENTKLTKMGRQRPLLNL